MVLRCPDCGCDVTQAVGEACPNCRRELGILWNDEIDGPWPGAGAASKSVEQDTIRIIYGPAKRAMKTIGRFGLGALDRDGDGTWTIALVVLFCAGIIVYHDYGAGALVILAAFFGMRLEAATRAREAREAPAREKAAMEAAAREKAAREAFARMPDKVPGVWYTVHIESRHRRGHIRKRSHSRKLVCP